MKTRLLDAALVVIGGVLYGLALPPHDLNVTAWITLVPLFAVATRTTNLGAFAAGFAYGTVFFSEVPLMTVPLTKLNENPYSLTPAGIGGVTVTGPTASTRAFMKTRTGAGRP